MRTPFLGDERAGPRQAMGTDRKPGSLEASDLAFHRPLARREAPGRELSTHVEAVAAASRRCESPLLSPTTQQRVRSRSPRA